MKKSAAVIFSFLFFVFLLEAFTIIDDDAILRKKAADDFKTSITDTQFNSSDELHWTGSTSSCKPGKVPGSVYAKLLKRINYFRRLAGIHDDIIIDSSWNKYAQAAALMMYASNDLDHDPKPTMKCYSADGKTGAGTSNLSMFEGISIRDLIIDEVEDGDATNPDCGHRRWILFSGLTKVGLGITDGTYALKVMPNDFDDTVSFHGNVPAYFAYPSSGYIPYEVVFQKWSFAVPGGADFTDAVVNINAGGTHIPCGVISRNEQLYGDPTLVWSLPQIKEDFDYNYFDMNEKKAAFKDLGLLEKKVTVNITGVKVDGVAKTYSYSFTIFDPEN
ncbi:MAG TPA: CAP domain-containing protein [Bacteroidia bacterium]|jgi:hypothetical protein|nr:CAP domain-containing protein [Bacteroidia bacterium]